MEGKTLAPVTRPGKGEREKKVHHFRVTKTKDKRPGNTDGSEKKKKKIFRFDLEEESVSDSFSSSIDRYMIIIIQVGIDGVLVIFGVCLFERS